MVLAGLAILFFSLWMVVFEDPEQSAIETCMAFVASDDAFKFSPEWERHEYQEWYGSENTSIYIKMFNLQIPVRLQTTTVVNNDSGKVIRKQCDLIPLSARQIHKIRKNNLENFKPTQPLSAAIMEKVMMDYMRILVDKGAAVDVSKLAQSISYPHNTSIKAFKTCQENSIKVEFSIHSEEKPQVIKLWPWTISVQRREGLPDGCK